MGPAWTRDRRELRRFLLGTSALIVAGGAGALAQSHLLSDPPPGTPDVVRFEVSPDGRWAVYGDGLRLLHSARTHVERRPELLDARPVSGTAFAISPDSRRVVYRAIEGGASHLTSVAIDGSSAPVPLGEPGEFVITPDSRKVVVDGLDELVCLSIDGADAPVPIHSSTRIEGFVVTPDSSRVVFVVEGATAGGGAVFVAPLDGSQTPLRLDTLAATGADHLLVSPDSSHLVYRRGAHGAVGRLYGVALDGSGVPVQLSVGSTSVSWFSRVAPKITAEGRVVFKHDVIQPGIFVAPVTGATPAISVSSALGAGFTLEYELTPDDARVLFVHFADFAGSDAVLYAAPLDALSPPLPLSAALAGEVVVSPFRLDPDGSHAAFFARTSPAHPFSLWSVPVDGSAPPLQLAELPDGMEPPGVDGLQYARGGAVLAYAAFRRGTPDPDDDVIQIHAVRTDAGGPSSRLDGPMARGGSVRFTPFRPDGTSGGIYFRVAAAGKRVVYLADQRDDGRFELFAAEVPSFLPPARAGTIR